MVSDRPPQPHRPNVPSAISIAGSDPSGGAGIQADLKTFAAFGIYGAAVLTALTAQNTRGVVGIHAVPPAFVKVQLDALAEDLRVHAIKIGMVATAETAAVVADAISDLACEDTPPAIVVDPVMVSKAGDPLVEDDAVAAIRDHLLPLATVITPNRHEAARLLGEPRPPESCEDLQDAAVALSRLTSAAVLLTGGGPATRERDIASDHGNGGEIHDVLVDHGEVRVSTSPRIDTPHVHGTGCAFSSAIAAGLARGRDLEGAIDDARRWLSEALRRGRHLGVGLGHGPPDHLHAVRDDLARGDA